MAFTTPAWYVPRGWVVAAVVWLSLAYLLLQELHDLEGERLLLDAWRLTSLLWAQFGLAGVLAAGFKGHHHRIPLQLIVTLFPPLLLYLLMLLLLRP